jgi:hypothetical protein
MTSIQKGKLDQLLKKQINYHGKIMTWQDILNDKQFIFKSITIETISNKRVHLAYVELNKSKITYYLEDQFRHLLQVPKMIYDLSTLPEKKIVI